jgi:peptidoglycan/LPS O-acetylase OafA/YrhL
MVTEGCLQRGLLYRRDLDGLRAVAVIPVILFHLGVPHFQGGFVGVDVFFVLSGFFITRQIVAELEQDRFSVIEFYDRRIRRLLPALFVMLFVASLAAAIILLPDDLQRFGRSLVAATLSLSNVYFLRQSDYFSPAAETMPLLHTWSLSIEEQFYLLFPAALIVLRRFTRIRLPLALGLLFFASLGLSIWATHYHPEAAFYLLPTRAWELLLGSIIAVAPQNLTSNTTRIRRCAPAVGLVMIGTAIHLFHAEMPFPGIAALLPCLGCALVICAGEGQDGNPLCASGRPSLVGKFLSLSPLVLVGLMSYSLYLWHWPIIVFLKYSATAPAGLSFYILAVTAIGGAAYASWRFVENPMRRGDWIWTTNAQRFAYSAVGVIAIVGVGAALDRTEGLKALQRADVSAMLENSKDVSPFRNKCHFSDTQQGRRSLSEACTFGAEGGLRLVMFGDSHGVEVSYALAQSAEKGAFHFTQITASGCPPAMEIATSDREGCNLHNKRMLDEISQIGPAIVVIAARYFKWSADDSATRDRFWPSLERMT